jgi:hypothetical protein
VRKRVLLSCGGCSVLQHGRVRRVHLLLLLHHGLLLHHDHVEVRLLLLHVRLLLLGRHLHPECMLLLFPLLLGQWRTGLLLLLLMLLWLLLLLLLWLLLLLLLRYRTSINSLLQQLPLDVSNVDAVESEMESEPMQQRKQVST